MSDRLLVSDRKRRAIGRQHAEPSVPRAKPEVCELKPAARWLLRWHSCHTMEQVEAQDGFASYGDARNPSGFLVTATETM